MDEQKSDIKPIISVARVTANFLGSKQPVKRTMQGLSIPALYQGKLT